MKEIISRMILPRRVPKNPQPFICKDGDCGACVLAGVFKKQPQWAYDNHVTGQYHNGKEVEKISCFNLRSMERTLDKLQREGYIEHHIPDKIFVESRFIIDEWRAFGNLSHMHSSGYYALYRALITGGYYKICTVSNNGKGLEGGQLSHTTDHWILVNGYREYWEPVPKVKGSKAKKTEIHLSNSSLNSPHAQWISMNDFLKFWGGTMGFWVKPAS